MKRIIIILLTLLPTLCLAQKTSKLTLDVNGVSFNMIFVKGGTFQMGATAEQGDDADHDEKPVLTVKLSDFYIGETEVTQGLWKAIMKKNPSRLTAFVSTVFQFSRSVMSDSLRPHGLQHTRLPCPSPTPGACSNSCPLSR